jgi:hypothetical protein
LEPLANEAEIVVLQFLLLPQNRSPHGLFDDTVL